MDSLPAADCLASYSTDQAGYLKGERGKGFDIRDRRKTTLNPLF